MTAHLPRQVSQSVGRSVSRQGRRMPLTARHRSTVSLIPFESVVSRSAGRAFPRSPSTYTCHRLSISVRLPLRRRRSVRDVLGAFVRRRRCPPPSPSSLEARGGQIPLPTDTFERAAWVSFTPRPTGRGVGRAEGPRATPIAPSPRRRPPPRGCVPPSSIPDTRRAPLVRIRSTRVGRRAFFDDAAQTR